jgi:hypothetical protein
MKTLGTFIAAFLLTGVTAFASTTSITKTDLYNRGYGNSFIFVEQGVEFAVFPDGQFDFNVRDYGPNFSAYADFGNVGISFNTGYSYDAYVQYDDFGAVIQIENVPVYYDYYGRIVQAGNVHIRYNNFGRVARVGGLYVHYNRYNRFSYCSGFINVYNRHYVYRPWHTYYAAPVVNLRIVLNRPYRQYYRPIRHTYYRPYRDNYRPRVSYNAGRRDARVAATHRRSDRYIQDSGRQSKRIADNSRNITRRGQVKKVAPKSTVSKRSVDRRSTSTSRSTIAKRPVTRNGNTKAIKRSTRTVEKRATPAKRVAKTNTQRKTNSIKQRSNNRSQRVATSAPKRKTVTRSSKSNTSKRSRGNQ